MTVLYIILGLLAVLFSVLVAVTFIKSGPELKENTQKYSQEEMQFYAERLAKMIRCKTVSRKDSYDDTEFKKLRDTVAELFPEVHEKAGIMYFSQDCWSFKIPGRDSERNIMLMSHHDVVDISDKWQHDGFGGEISEGKLWGRGTVDTKTPLFAEFSALEELIEEGYEPPCNVYIVSSHNEELCGDGVPLANEYFKKHGIEFEVILDEGGAVIEPPLGGMKCSKCAMVAVHEKGRYYLNCKAEAGTSHASLTAADKLTPVEAVAGFISELMKGKIFIRRLNPQIKAMFRAMAPYCGFGMRLVLSNLWLFGPLLTRLLPEISAQAGGLLGTTCAFNKIEGSKGTVSCSTEAFLRPVDEKDFQQDMRRLRELAEKYGIEVSEDARSEYHAPADLEDPRYEYTMDCVRHCFPQYPAVPFILPAGTDARTFTDICRCVMRFAPITLSAQQLASVHSEEENIDLSSIAEAVSFYKYFLKNYK